ncbi:hypothetical protein GGR49_002868 [Sphingomonas carotinifaciens]|nr:hypothetical protein [Sphingomonas carotinifaciens]
MIKQRVGYLAIMRLPSSQVEPDREFSRIDGDVDIGGKSAA